MTNLRQGALSELARQGFNDLSGALADLDKLVELLGDSARPSTHYLSQGADPDSALKFTVLLAETESKRLKKVISNEISATAYFKSVAVSEGVQSILQRIPDYLDVYLQRDFQMDKKFMSEAMASATDQDELRRIYRKLLLGVVAFDVSHAPSEAFDRVSLMLADLAAAALQRAFELACVENGQGQDFPMSIIAMGKTGGLELNYVSDVDVIFACSDEVDDEQLQIATKIANRLMRMIDSTSTEPPLWEVDPNLRPEGKDGAMVRRIRSHLSYYQKWAKNWEFQALIKARHIAGDAQTGKQYEQTIGVLAWDSLDSSRVVEEVRGMRKRVLDNLPKEQHATNLKLGIGGLRDIEFTVQLLQLVHGRHDESVRDQNTLKAIQSLTKASYLGRKDAQAFTEYYKYLRSVEHRLQLRGLKRTHLLPEDGDTRTLARAINPQKDPTDFSSSLSEIRKNVKQMHESVFFRPLLNMVADLETDDFMLQEEDTNNRLRALGFADPKAALGHIRALTKGVSRRASIQRQLLPVMLRWLSEGDNPDRALISFRRLSEDLGDSHWFLGMLRDSSGAAENLCTLLGFSQLGSALLERNPQATAWLAEPAQRKPRSKAGIQIEADAVFDRHDDAEKRVRGIQRLRRKESLRVAMASIFGDAELTEQQNGLSDIYEIYLENIAREVMAEIDVDLGIIAMGRFGGRELGFGSDADVVFVYSGDSSSQEAEKAVNAIRDATKDSVLEFELDMDLRPEGKKGAIVRSLDSYRSYYEKWGEIWEAQALLRSRPIFGSEQLRAEFSEMSDKHRYPETISESNIREIRRIKARVESERLPMGADPTRHLKLGRGSISDVEWLVQLYQLRFGNEYTSIQTPFTLKALTEMSTAGLIGSEDAEILKNAWTLSSSIRSGIVLATGKKNDVLPNDQRVLESIRQLLHLPGIESGAELEQEYLGASRKARAIFENLFFA
jgi:glutamate-ammonia-ligase adenylyltransferase